MRNTIYILIVLIFGYSCNNPKSKKASLTTAKDSIIKESSSVAEDKKLQIGKYIIGKSKDYQNLEFSMVDKDFKLTDSLFTYKPIGEVYTPDYPCRIDTINWVCYFFDYEANYESDSWISNFLISFDLKTGKYKKLRDFKDFNIDEWEPDLTRHLLIFRDYELNKLFTYNLDNNRIDTLFDFAPNTPWFLKMRFTSDKYELISKENKRTIRRTIDFKNGNKVRIDTIWETPSPLTKAEFKINKGIFVEVAPNEINQDIATLFKYDEDGNANQKLLNFKYTGNYRGIYWINDKIIVRNQNQILIFNQQLELLKTIDTGILKDIFYSDNQFIIFEQFQPTKEFLKFDSSFELTNLDSELFDNLMIIKAVPNKRFIATGRYWKIEILATLA